MLVWLMMIFLQVYGQIQIEEIDDGSMDYEWSVIEVLRIVKDDEMRNLSDVMNVVNVCNLLDNVDGID
jgi:hypothetical protein